MNDFRYTISEARIKELKAYCFESERLSFHGITTNDASDIVRWRSDPEIYKGFFASQPVSLEAHLEWFKKYLQDESRYDFIVSIKEVGKKIGVVGLQNIVGQKAEVAYMIGEIEEQGKGYGTEAVNKMTQVGFDVFECTSIEAVIKADNKASIELIKRVGFREMRVVYSLCKEGE